MNSCCLVFFVLHVNTLTVEHHYSCQVKIVCICAMGCINAYNTHITTATVLEHCPLGIVHHDEDEVLWRQ